MAKSTIIIHYVLKDGFRRVTIQDISVPLFAQTGNETHSEIYAKNTMLNRTEH
jgi:hypothetical protein